MQHLKFGRRGAIILSLFPSVILLAIHFELCNGFQAVTRRKSPIRPLFRNFHSRNIVVWSTDNPNQELHDGDARKQSFWNSQKELATALSTQTKISLRQEQAAKFEKRRLALVVDTAYIAWFIFCACWMLFPNPMSAISYSFGATMGMAYTYGLGKSVEVLGQSIDDVGATQGAGVGEARFAFLILLFLFVGKFRGGDFGLQEIPSIAGFFTYQIASLNQGLREIND